MEGTMNLIRIIGSVLFVIFILMIVLITGQTQEKAQHQEKPLSIEVAAPLHYVRIYSDANGQSHFAEEKATFQLVDYAPPALPISVSEVFAAEGVSFISSPPGWFGDWHPAPRRQFIFMLIGELEVEVSDGEVRKFVPGAVLLVEDTTGKGHISRVISKERAYLAVVPLK
jgi:quercetin dioxygenase-like cupin family protein